MPIFSFPAQTFRKQEIAKSPKFIDMKKFSLFTYFVLNKIFKAQRVLKLSKKNFLRESGSEVL